MRLAWHFSTAGLRWRRGHELLCLESFPKGRANCVNVLGAVGASQSPQGNGCALFPERARSILYLHKQHNQDLLRLGGPTSQGAPNPLRFILY